ncbi:acetyl-CoA synthetase-like protein [Zopfia rhizophila CBS 207.26]|uniref:Acetyl-CoA synthetase-like protein n=1 Tax=Zopfia rhizophila CBS 207.26 TaxID=1314779 RepID=A0A6A6E6X7_9PEZI|nr:acetyl-CoA synthetase-like protein [Zopfia rhizophila CBS 207.26]
MDRTLLVPPHQGPNVFPNSPNRIAIKDVNLGVEKTYGDLLADALALRRTVEATLSSETMKRFENGEEIYIGVLAAGGYEFAVAVMTVLAMGAAVVPMTISVPKQVAILSSSEASPLASAIVDFVKSQGSCVRSIVVLPNLPRVPTYKPMEMVVSSNRCLDDSSPGVVIFTSGTTGRPKGAVMRRAYTHETALAIGEGYDIDHNDVLLHVLPVHHTTGLGISFFPYLVAGACIEFRSGSFDPSWIWNRWLKGEPTSHHEMRNERPILTRYGATEFPGCIKVPAGTDPGQLPADCVGMPVPGVELKLTEGDHGELLVKSPNMFSKYLYDDQATINAHDADGYFKTGDICRREGHLYFITGRASIDIIKSDGYKISATDIERACLELPYIDEVAVVGVNDSEYGQRVEAVVSIKASDAECGKKLSLEKLRTDLKTKMASYKLPTLLRIVDGELPKGPTGKVQKKLLGPRLIRSPGWQNDRDVQAWRRGKVLEDVARL